jgi:hypothetical protein
MYAKPWTNEAYENPSSRTRVGIVTSPEALATQKLDIIKSISFGQRVAEDERDDLASYFVETEHWRRVWAGDVDVVFAPKGGGKSAIYSMLVSRESELFDRGVLLAAAENPTGAPAFQEVGVDPPTSEAEFIGLWKLYFLALTAQTLQEYEVRGDSTTRLVAALQDAGLLTGDKAKRRVVRRVMDYVRRYFHPTSVEGGVKLDPVSGQPIALTTKITFDEPSASQAAEGSLFVDDLYEAANEALASAGSELWLVLDRLDVAFADSQELEENALRALFRVYRDLQPLENMTLKIFLRSDIWKAITAGGFREASHITRELTVDWNDGTLLRLVLQRLVRSEALRTYYGVDADTVLRSVSQQEALFARVFPEQVDLGQRKPKTFDWCLSRTRDGHGGTAPRELIHLMSAARDKQLRRHEIGEPPPSGENVFDRQAFRDAVPEVSEVRLTKTIYAEYPAMRPYIEALEGQKTHHNVASLTAALGESDQQKGRAIADRLVEIGFFERRGDRLNPTYWVPFLYRPALRMVQGSADGVTEQSDEDDAT